MNTNAKRALAVAAGAGAVVALRALRGRATYDFRDKSVLITGGSRGLGLVMAREFAAQGARLTIVARDRHRRYTRAAPDGARAGPRRNDRFLQSADA